jgi:DNA-binding ferritin-like protein
MKLFNTTKASIAHTRTGINAATATALLLSLHVQTEAARAEAAALQATLSERDVTITTMTSEATSAAAKLQSVEEQLCEVEHRAAAATVAHDTAAESAAVQIKQVLQQLSEQADTVKVHILVRCVLCVL